MSETLTRYNENGRRIVPANILVRRMVRPTRMLAGTDSTNKDIGRYGFDEQGYWPVRIRRTGMFVGTGSASA